MKKIIFFVTLCCVTALFAPPETRAQSAQTVNESGGTGLNDGLKFVVNTDGALAVYRDNHAQYYPGKNWSDVGGRGNGVRLTFRFSKATSYSTTTKPLQVCSTTPVVKTGNTYKTSISGYVESSLSDDNFFVTLDVTYTHPNNYFMVDYFVRAPRTLSSAGQTVHMYLDHDAMILGCDASYGYTSKNGTGHFVGDYRPVNCGTCPGPGNLTGIDKYKNPSCHGFKVDNEFRSSYTGYYGNRGSVNSALELSNTYNTGMTDDGIAVEFTAGPFNQSGQTLVRRVAHCYGNNKGEFDNLAINVPAAPTVSAPVTVNFASAQFAETEGNHAIENVKITVSGGVLASDQVCAFTVSGGTAAENTDYTYVKGFTIPADDYTTPKEIVLTNVTLIDNSACNEDKWMNITIDEPSECNDLLIRGSSSTAKITIADDEARPEITTSLSDATYNTSEVVPSMTLASDVAGATISWTNSNPAIGLAASGTGDIPSFTATNTTASPITATISVKATADCAGATKTFTITVNSKFDITYDYSGGVAPSTANPTDYLVASLPLSITNPPTRTGYTFAGWTCTDLGVSTPANPFVIPVNTTQDLNLVADWGSGANVYNMTFNVPAGITHSNSDRTYTYEDNVTVADPTLSGFTFKGWTIANDEPSSPAISPTKNVSWAQHTIYGNLQFSITAPTGPTTPEDTTNWSPKDYNITYNYSSGVAPSTANPTTYNALTGDIALNAPTRDGYTFKGWTITSSESAVTFLPLTQTIPGGSYGNLTCVANWDENGYTISYNLNGAEHPQTPIAYSFTDQVSVANPALPGYTFAGWTITNSESASPAISPTTNVSFGPSTVFGNLTFTVSDPPTSGGGNGNWNQITYNITYNLNGGSHGANHPNTYKVTDNVSIDIPTKTGYTFGGWTITSDSLSSPLPTSGNPATTFGPSNGVYGNLIFTANWSTDSYTITYDAGAPDASFTNNTNPGTYDIEDTPINLTNAGAQRNGYTFDGWSVTSDAAGVTIPDGMSVPAGSYGNLVSTAKWTVNNYTISFSVPAAVINPNTDRTYTYEENVTIANPSVPGYTFRGWTITNDSLSAPAIAPINSAWSQHTVYGNLVFSVTDPATDPANWDKIAYDITYDLNGGTPPATANPTQYNVQTQTITLNEPTRTGYTFRGWTITSDSVAVTFTDPTTTIPTGSYGNLTCRANWGVNPYTITYNVASGVTHPLTPTGYTFEDNVTIADPGVTGYTFRGWTISNDEPSVPAINPAKNVSWMPGTVFGNLTMAVELPTGDSTENWTKNKYAVIYNLNGGTGAVTVDPNSPYIWGRTVTVLGKSAGMIRTDAMYLGWTNTAVPLVTTQAAEDAITPTMSQAGNTFTMPVNDTTFYAVWAIDANGPGGGPDEIPDYKQVQVNYLPSSSVTASSGTYPSNVMFNKNTQGTVSANTGNLAATKKILVGWSTNNVPSIAKGGSLPSNYYNFGVSINIGTTAINLYAVWADDDNNNGKPDFLETTTPTPPPTVTQPELGGGDSGRRPGRRNLHIVNTDVFSPMDQRLRKEHFENSDISTRNDDDVWRGWDSAWDEVNIMDVAFADNCYRGYRIKTDTFGMMRTSYQALTGDFLYPNETFVPDDALIVWHYEFDAKNETELKDFLLNVDSLYRNYDSPYSGLYSITDTVAFKEIATMSSFYTAADVVAAGSSNPGVDGYIVSTDFVKSPSTGEARHYFQWPADSISQFKIDDPTGAGFGDYDEWANPYEIDIQFNKDLITKLSSGGSVKVWYEIVHGGSSNISMGSTYTPGDIFHESDKSVFKRVYRRFEPVDTLVSLHVSSKGRWDVKIDYGTPDLKRSIHGGSWKNAYAPLTDWEQLSVNDGAEIRLRDPGDLCGKIIHFNTYTPPVINHYVEIHSMDDVLKAYPVADQKHYVKGHDDFTFAATFKGEPLKVMAHGYYSGNKTELIGDSIGVNTYQYTIPQITEPFDIRILSEPASEVANKFEDYSSPRVWAHGSTLYIRKEEATEARVYNFSGILVKQLELNSDITTEVMERGAYVVELEGKHYKVIVR